MLGKKIIIHYKQIVNSIYIYCNRNNVLDRHLNTKAQLMGKGVCQASRINVTSLRVSMDNPILDPCILARTRIEKRTVILKVSYGHSLLP